MNKFVFRYFADCEDGKMARLETAELGIPVNVFAEDGTDYDLQEGENCKAELYGMGSLDMDVFASQEALYAGGCTMAVPSLIPMGTFPAHGDEDFEESPWILFVGTVREVETDPEAGPDRPNYCLTVDTLEMTMCLYLHHDGPIETGCILHGTAWLCGPVTRD